LTRVQNFLKRCNFCRNRGDISCCWIQQKFSVAKQTSSNDSHKKLNDTLFVFISNLSEADQKSESINKSKCKWWSCTSACSDVPCHQRKWTQRVTSGGCKL